MRGPHGSGILEFGSNEESGDSPCIIGSPGTGSTEGAPFVCVLCL